MTPEKLTLYAIRNKAGKWFRRKGYGGSGPSWVDEFHRARIFNRPGPARGVISFFVNNYPPDYGVPDLVELRVTDVVVTDETVRVREAAERKRVKEAAKAARAEKRKLERAQAEYDRAAANLLRAKGGK